jgi:hypothetical protein
VAAVAAGLSLKRSHPLSQAPVTLTQPSFGELADRRAAGAPAFAGLSVNPSEEIIGQRDHHLGHVGSIPGITSDAGARHRADPRDRAVAEGVGLPVGGCRLKTERCRVETLRLQLTAGRPERR